MPPIWIAHLRNHLLIPHTEPSGLATDSDSLMCCDSIGGHMWTYVLLPCLGESLSDRSSLYAGRGHRTMDLPVPPREVGERVNRSRPAMGKPVGGQFDFHEGFSALLSDHTDRQKANLVINGNRSFDKLWFRRGRLILRPNKR